MKTKTTIAVFTMAAVLLTSGFGISSVDAAKNSSVSILAKVPSTLNNHSVIFQYCAGENNMRAPEVIITSDSQVKKVQLNKMIASDTCKTTSATIKALDSDTIHVKKVDKSNINKMIASKEKRLVNIKNEISIQNDNLTALLESLPGGSNEMKPENIKKVNDLTTKLSELRADLKEVRSSYYELLYILRS